MIKCQKFNFLTIKKFNNPTKCKQKIRYNKIDTITKKLKYKIFQ